MTPVPAQLDVERAVDRARAMADGPGRGLLGIAGPPGAGKSTLAQRLADEVGPAAAVVAMDGFHLADVALRRLGRLDRKGAPDTFDVAGYVALLWRLREDTADVIYAPAFERTLEQPIAGSIAVPPTARLVITEGNYLLLEDAPWAEIREVLDEIWWLEPDPTTRRQRLLARHVEFGKTPEAAREWVERVDDPNAARLVRGRERADVMITRP